MFDILQLLDGVQYASEGNLVGLQVSGACADSKTVQPGNVFFCIKGKHCNGGDYMEQAVRRGAKAVVCECACRSVPKGIPLITVKNTRSAYAIALSKIYGYDKEKTKIIAVTGTNGKTTVCSMISSALNLSGRKCAFIGTLGAKFEDKVTDLSTMTTPDPEVLYSLICEYSRAGAQYVVMEASSHALALNKLDGLCFDVGAITNMSAEHLDFHVDMKEYYKAKKQLFTKCKKGVFLCDDCYTVSMYKEAPCKAVSCSVTDKAYDYYAENIGYSFENGTVFTVVGKDGTLPLYSDIPAEFTVSNALLSAVVLKEIGLSSAEIYKGISALHCVEGRMQRIETFRDFSVFIDFAHTPDALSRLLSSVNQLKRSDERTVTLIGCGGDRDRSKRSLMGAVASHLSDMVIITADNSRSEDTSAIIDEIMSGIDKNKPYIRIEDREKAIEYAVMNAGRGDIILLCGKGHEQYEIGKNGKRPFSEKEIVERALQKRKSEKEG